VSRVLAALSKDASRSSTARELPSATRTTEPDDDAWGLERYRMARSIIFKERVS
jgi:hypothetical protein